MQTADEADAINALFEKPAKEVSYQVIKCQNITATFPRNNTCTISIGSVHIYKVALHKLLIRH